MEQGNRRGHLSILLLLLAVSVMEVYCTRELRIHVNLIKYHNPTALSIHGEPTTRYQIVKGLEITVYFTAKSRGDIGQWRVPGLPRLFDQFIYFGRWPGSLPYDFAPKITPDMAHGIKIEIVFVRVLDNGEKTHYDEFLVNIKLPENLASPVNFYNFTRGNRGAPSELQLDYSVQILCNEDHYYGPMCLVYCKPEDSDNGHYICDQSGNKICKPGYLDEQNDCKRENECYHGYCKNRGRCEIKDEKYKCHCKPFYYRETCDVRCKPEDGDNGHYDCNDIGQKNCKHGWLDEQNDCKRENKCTRGYCKNGGTCRPLQGEAYKCFCPPTHTGDTCEIEVTTCDAAQKQSANCSIGGNCAVNNGTLMCTCSIGFAGTKCEVEVDLCVTLKPCRNNGTCQSKPREYTCQCTEGMGGTDCDKICGPDVQCNNTEPRNSDLQRALEAWGGYGTRPLPWTLAVFMGAAVAVASRLRF